MRHHVYRRPNKAPLRTMVVAAALAVALTACGGSSSGTATTAAPATTKAMSATTEAMSATTEAMSATTEAMSATTEAMSATTAATPTDMIKMNVGATAPSFSYGMPLTMVANGIDKKNGLEVNYVAAGTSSTNVVAGVMSGEYDVGFAAASTALDAINQGSEMIIVAGGLSSASVLVVRPEVLTDAGITADAPVEELIAALKGKTIASSPDGSGNNSAFRNIVKTYGLDPDTDMKVVGVTDATAIVAGIKAGRFDGGYYGSGVLEANVVDGSGVLILRSADLDLFKGYLGLAGFTTREYATANPEAIDRLYAALSETATLIHTDTEGVGKALQTQFFPQLDTAIFDVSWTNAVPAYPDTPSYPKSAWDRLIKIQSASGEKDYSGLVYTDVVYSKAQG